MRKLILMISILVLISFLPSAYAAPSAPALNSRPLILLWLAFETPNQPLDIVASSTPNVEDWLATATKQRSLAIILPMLDAVELSRVNVADILDNNVGHLQPLAARYHSEALLIGHIAAADDGLNSQWRLVLGDDKWNWDVSGKTIPDILNNITNNVADILDSKFGAVKSGNQVQISLQVTGINDYKNLIQVMQVLQKISVVSDVQFAAIDKKQVTFKLSVGGRQAFINAIDIDDHFKTEPNASFLQYHWIQ